MESIEQNEKQGAKRERSNEGKEAFAPSPAQRSRLQSAPAPADAAFVRQMAQSQMPPNADVRGLSNTILGQHYGVNPQLQAQQLMPGNQLAAGGLFMPQAGSFGGGSYAPPPMLNPYGLAPMTDHELAMRQLNAQQLQMLSQPGHDPSVLVQLFSMQNQAVAQSMNMRAAQLPTAANPAAVSALAVAGAAANRLAQPQLAGAQTAAMNPQRHFVAARGDALAQESPAKPEPPSAGLTGRPPLKLHTSLDEGRLTPYQCLARQHLEYFEADQGKVEEGAQGRNKAIVLGQVGIRCIHCSHLKRKEKAPAAAFYPSKLSGLYQSAQNIINSHLAKDCTKVPEELRTQLLSLGNRKSAPGAGKAYWGDEATRVGVFEDTNGLRFSQAAPAAAAEPRVPAGHSQQQSIPAERPVRVAKERPIRVPKERPVRVPVERPPVEVQLEP